MKTKAISLICSAMLASLAANAAEPIDDYKYNPYYAKVGTTIFVSGHFKHWVGKLLPGGWVAKPDEEKIERIVFVNATSERQEKTGAAEVLNRKLQSRGISTVAIGRCDLFCSRIFIGGKQRHFGKDLNGSPAMLDIQTPIDYDTKKIEPRFPAGQFAVFEAWLPELASNKDLFFHAFVHGGMDGGWHIAADGTSIFCKSWITKHDCIDQSKSARDMGLITASERQNIELPPRFPAPVATAFAKVDDVNAVPTSSEGRQKYAELLDKPGIKAFAISQDGKSFGGAWNSELAAARALYSCESKSSSPCRLYLSDEGVVW